MSLDKSLKSKTSLARHRNVLSRAERVANLMEHEKWNDGDSVFGLVKIAHRKAKVGGKVKEKGEAAAAEGAAQPPAPPAK